MTTHQALGRRVAAARAVADLSQQQLADTLGIQRSAVSDIENGVRKLTAVELAPLAAALDCGIGWLLGTEPVDSVDVYTAGHLDGWHDCAEAMTPGAWTPPTTEQIKARMLARRYGSAADAQDTNTEK